MHTVYAQATEFPRGAIFDENPGHAIESFFILIGILIVLGLGAIAEHYAEKSKGKRDT